MVGFGATYLCKNSKAEMVIYNILHWEIFFSNLQGFFPLYYRNSLVVFVLSNKDHLLDTISSWKYKAFHNIIFVIFAFKTIYIIYFHISTFFWKFTLKHFFCRISEWSLYFCSPLTILSSYIGLNLLYCKEIYNMTL